MPRVMIHSRDHTVEVEEDGTDLHSVAAKAREMWEQVFSGPATEERES